MAIFTQYLTKYPPDVGNYLVISITYHIDCLTRCPIGLRILPIRPRPQAFEPRGYVGVWPEVDIDERYDVEHRRDGEVDDAERAEDIVLAGELAVEHRQETIEARLRVGNDVGLVAALAEEGLHPPLPDQPAERRFGVGGPPEQPLIDLRLRGGIGRREPALGPFGREIFQDRRGFPQHEPAVLDRRDSAVGIFRQVFGRAQLALLEIERDPVERDAELGRQQAHLARVRRSRTVVELDRHAASYIAAGGAGAIRLVSAAGDPVSNVAPLFPLKRHCHDRALRP